MNRRKKNIIILLSIVFGILLLLVLILREKEEYKKISHEEKNISLLIENKKNLSGKNIKKTMVKLYYKNVFFKGGPLKVITPEVREVEGSENFREFAHILFNELKSKPKGRGLREVIPENAILKQIFKKNSTLFLDFSPEIIPQKGTDILGEVAIVYSIVNTFSENFIDVKGIKILIDGREKKTFSGHLDISGTLKFNSDCVAGSGTGKVIEEENLN